MSHFDDGPVEHHLKAFGEKIREMMKTNNLWQMSVDSRDYFEELVGKLWNLCIQHCDYRFKLEKDYDYEGGMKATDGKVYEKWRERMAD